MKRAEFIALAYAHGIKPFDVWRQEGDDKCNCLCHQLDDNGSTSHVVPCCQTCDRCGMRIRSECYDAHMLSCKGN